MWDWNIWYRNTTRYPVYEEQLNEVFQDVQSLGKTYLDVGCGKGRLLNKLVDIGKEVDGLDLYYNNFDLLKDEWPDKKYDVIVCNLVLCHFSKDELSYVKDRILGRLANYLYIFDEYRADKACCELLDEKTHKFYHDYPLHFRDSLNEIYQRASEKGSWTRQVYQKNG